MVDDECNEVQKRGFGGFVEFVEFVCWTAFALVLGMLFLSLT